MVKGTRESGEGAGYEILRPPALFILPFYYMATLVKETVDGSRYPA